MKYLHLNQYNVLCNKCNNQVMSKQNQHTETMHIGCSLFHAGKGFLATVYKHKHNFDPTIAIHHITQNYSTVVKNRIKKSAHIRLCCKSHQHVSIHFFY